MALIAKVLTIMMKNIAFSCIILIVCISYASLEIYNSKDRFTNLVAKNSTNNSNCIQDGITCKSCSELVSCEKNDNGTFTEHPMGRCSSNETCLNGNCTTRPNPKCPSKTDMPFICRTPGVFPDPHDCKMYHYCLRSEASNSTNGWNGTSLVTHTDVCECGYAFNAQTNFCDVKLSNEDCWDYPSAYCSYRGQTAAWWVNPRLYYICLPYPGRSDLYPFMYACENGKIYEDREYLCKWP